MIIEKPEVFKEWLTSTLGKMCDADPDALGKYILALIRKEKKELKTLLLEQLDVFLQDATVTFVDLILDALKTKSYVITTSSDNVAVELSSSADVPPETDSLKKEEQLSQKTKPKTTDKSHRNCAKKRRSIDDKHISVHKKIRPSFYKPSSFNAEDITKSNSMGGDMQHKDNTRSHSKDDEKCIPTLERKVEITQSRSDSISKDEPLSPKKMQMCDSTPHGDTDYRDKTFAGGGGKGKIKDLQSSLTLNTNVHKENVCYSTKQSTRCKDYDEKGYCLRGNFCHYDHGADPILVDHSPHQFLTNLKAANFSVNLTSERFEGSKSIMPPLPTSPPPRIPPPPPPLPPPYFTEPYNPEAPGLNLNFYNRADPTPPTIIPLTSAGMPSLFGNADAFHSKPKPREEKRVRELINITKAVDASNVFQDNSENKDDRNRTFLKNLKTVSQETKKEMSDMCVESDFKTKKRFDFSRLGPPRTTLEIRKIPKRLNTIANLHNHFSKFGIIVNIEINEPEAAKISFSTNSEATAAYRSTDAILSNRFIKIFWSNDDGKQKLGSKKFHNYSNETNTAEFPPSPSPEQFSKRMWLDNISPSNDKAPDGMEKIVEKQLLSQETVTPRTVVYAPNCIKKANKVTSSRASHESQGITSHKVKLHQAKTQLVENAVQNQKLILEQLLKAKSKKEKLFLKKALDNISKKLDDLTKDLKKDNKELKCLLTDNTPPNMVVSKIAAKELLDAELDLYKKQHTLADEDTTELLLKKVNEMKSKAKTLGLIESSISASKIGFRKHRNSRGYMSSSLSIDHRPKKILVLESNKEGLMKHFKQFGEVERMYEIAEGTVVTFYTRAEAETAYAYGAKFEGSHLTLSWFSDPPLKVTQTPDAICENSEQKMIATQPTEADDEEEEDEEEDSEARSWRR